MNPLKKWAQKAKSLGLMTFMESVLGTVTFDPITILIFYKRSQPRKNPVNPAEKLYQRASSGRKFCQVSN